MFTSNDVKPGPEGIPSETVAIPKSEHPDGCRQRAERRLKFVLKLSSVGLQSLESWRCPLSALHRSTLL